LPPSWYSRKSARTVSRLVALSRLEPRVLPLPGPTYLTGTAPARDGWGARAVATGRGLGRWPRAALTRLAFLG